MGKFIKRSLLVLIPLLIIGAGVVSYIAYTKGVFASDTVFTTDAGAIGGYDPVAYFTENKAVPGFPGISTVHAGSDWHFSSDENKALFLADPAKYLPQYGGYCAYARSIGFTAYSDPTAWSVVNDRLYLNLSHDVKAVWETEAAERISSADAYWLKLQPE